MGNDASLLAPIVIAAALLGSGCDEELRGDTSANATSDAPTEPQPTGMAARDVHNGDWFLMSLKEARVVHTESAYVFAGYDDDGNEIGGSRWTCRVRRTCE